jgi:hypothetical protein
MQGQARQGYRCAPSGTGAKAQRGEMWWVAGWNGACETGRMTWNRIFATAALMAVSGNVWAAEDEVLVQEKEPAQLEEPAQPEQPAKEEWACASEDMERVLEQVKPRLVVIEGRLDNALGFAFHDRRHVLTTFGAVFWADAVHVRMPDGESVEARVVAVDSENDLAILELPLLLAKPLPIGEKPRVGDPVYAVGTTDYGGSTPTVHAGLVNSVKDELFHTDALENSFFKLGGPIVACKGGGVVGIARQGWGDESMSLGPARALVGQIGVQPEYEGPPVRPNFEAGLLMHAGEDIAGGGMSLGLNLIGRGGWEVKNRLGVVVAGELETGWSGARIFGQTAVGYRAQLDEDFSLTVNGGVAYVFERFCQDQCGDTAPQWTRHRVMPTIELGIQLWPATLTYQYMLDVQNPDLSIHQGLLGIDL